MVNTQDSILYCILKLRNFLKIIFFFSDESSGKDLEVFLSGGSATGPISLNSCNMCQNYEAGLQKAQQKVKELEKASELAERNLQRAKDDLAREHDFRQEMEVKWNEKKEQHKVQVLFFFFFCIAVWYFTMCFVFYLNYCKCVLLSYHN